MVHILLMSHYLLMKKKKHHILELAEKWKLQTQTSAFTVTQHPKVEKQGKTVRRSKRLQNKCHQMK